MCILCEVKELIAEISTIDKSKHAVYLFPGLDIHALKVLKDYVELIRIEQPSAYHSIQEVIRAIEQPKSERLLNMEALLNKKVETMKTLGFDVALLNTNFHFHQTIH